MEQNQLYYKEMSTPIGPISIIANDTAVVRIDFGTIEQVQVKIDKWLQKHFSNPVYIHGHPLIEQAITELEEFFANKRKRFTIPYQLHGTPFQQAVWRATEQFVPYGETKTYQQIAELIDNEKAVRAIGGALGKNPCSIVVPCHRVIGSDGKMVGYSGGLDKKTYLLHAEQT